MPKFILEGRLCWVRAPLYILTKGKDNAFAYDDKELEKVRKGKERWTQHRAKGLGALNAEQMSQSMMSKEHSRVEVLTVEDVEKSFNQLVSLMGEDVEFRKEFIYENIDFSKLLNM